MTTELSWIELRFPRYLAIVVLLIVASLATNMQPVQAATVPRTSFILTPGGDVFLNYDSHSNTHATRRTQVDWPVSIIFYNNSEVDKVKESLDEKYDRFGFGKYLRYSDITYYDQRTRNTKRIYDTDSDGGVKDTRCPGLYRQPKSNAHLRIYGSRAPVAERRAGSMYDYRWGYYNLGTTHRDFVDCFGSTKFGDPEGAEAEFVRYLRARGFYVSSTVYGLYNSEPYAIKGDSYRGNDGYAAAVSIDRRR